MVLHKRKQTFVPIQKPERKVQKKKKKQSAGTTAPRGGEYSAAGPRWTGAAAAAPAPRAALCSSVPFSSLLSSANAATATHAIITCCFATGGGLAPFSPALASLARGATVGSSCSSTHIHPVPVVRSAQPNRRNRSPPPLLLQIHPPLLETVRVRSSKAERWRRGRWRAWRSAPRCCGSRCRRASRSPTPSSPS